MTRPLKDKKILLGISGGIAAYKSTELIRLLTRSGAEVKVVMTENAARFVTPLTFGVLSGSPVITDIFSSDKESGISHIEQTDRADLFLIAPATANIIGKLASGIGDDALTTMALAFEGPFLIAPAMNTKMYKNGIVRENIERLERHGFLFTGPASGELACGYEGAGRMAEPAEIVESAICALYERDLEGRKILVTAGPTREMIDPVRFISNRSSGKMGYAVAREASRRGAGVTLISGPVSLEPPAGVVLIPVKSAEEMEKAVMEKSGGCDAVIMAAAVADYAPLRPAGRKIKKEGEETLILELGRTIDIIGRLGRSKGKRVLVGFAAETENLVKNAAKKLKDKGLDLIAANDVSGEGSGFDVDTNRVSIIDETGVIDETPLLGKDEIARRIVNSIKERLG